MLNLDDYAAYWEGLATRTGIIKSAIPVTVDEGMGKRLQSMRPDAFPALFYFPPGAEGRGSNPDNFAEDNICVVMVMGKYDPQRATSFDTLRTTQPAVEAVKAIMLDDQRRGCPFMRLDTSTINTMPETDLYTTLAGWSIGFRARDL